MNWENLYYDDKRLLSIFNYRKALIFLAYRQGNQLICKAKGFSGVVTIMRWRLKDAARLSASLRVKRGKVRLFIVDGKEIIPLLETDADQESSQFFDPGKYRVRIAAIDAEFEAQVSTRFS